MSTSERIEILRQKYGISLTHLNQAIGAYRGKLTEVRKGKASLNDNEISILAKELHTSTDYLLGKTGDSSLIGQKEQPTPVAEDGLSEDQKFLIDVVIDMEPDDVKRVRLLVEEIILRRGK